MRNLEFGYAQSVKAGARQYVKATVTWGDGEKTELAESDFVGGTLTFKDATSGNGSFDVGAAVIGSFEFVLNNHVQYQSSLNENGEEVFDHDEEGKLIPTGRPFDGKVFSGAVIDVEVGIRKHNDNYVFATEWAVDEAGYFAREDKEDFLATEQDNASNVEQEITWIKYGHYYFVSHTSVGDTIKCETYDGLVLLDNKKLSSHNINWGVASAYEIISTIAHASAIILENDQFPHNDYVFPTEPKSDMTDRQALSYICQCLGCYAKMNSEGLLRIAWYGDPVTTVKTRFDHDLDMENVKITGVRIYPTNKSSEDKSYVTGDVDSDDKYVIAIKDNPFIFETQDTTEKNDDGSTTEVHIDGNIEEVIQFIGTAVIGKEFRPGKMTILSDPAIEAGDMVDAFDDAGNRIHFAVTNITYKLTVKEPVVCDAKPRERTDLRMTNTEVHAAQLQQYVEQRADVIEKNLSDFDAYYAELAKAMTSSMGMYRTVTKDNIRYLHDKRNLYESVKVYKVTADGMAVTDNYQAGRNGTKVDESKVTWKAGLTAKGDLLTQTLTAIAVNADYLNVGKINPPSGNGSGDYWNLEDGTFHLGGSTGNTAITKDSSGNLTIVATSAQIANVLAGKIKASQIDVSGGKITADQINANNLEVSKVHSRSGNENTYIDGGAVRTSHIEFWDYKDSNHPQRCGGFHVAYQSDADGGAHYHVLTGSNIVFTGEARGDSNAQAGFSYYFGNSGGWCSVHCDRLYVKDGEVTAGGSDIRLKHDIHDISVSESNEIIRNLRPVSYKYNHETDRVRHGFIAQEVQKISAEDDFNPVFDGGQAFPYLNLNYNDIIADLVNVVQDQEKRIRALEKKVEELSNG